MVYKEWRAAAQTTRPHNKGVLHLDTLLYTERTDFSIVLLDRNATTIWPSEAGDLATAYRPKYVRRATGWILEINDTVVTLTNSSIWEKLKLLTDSLPVSNKTQSFRMATTVPAGNCVPIPTIGIGLLVKVNNLLLIFNRVFIHQSVTKLNQLLICASDVDLVVTRTTFDGSTPDV
jgi:hypothetical protein